MKYLWFFIARYLRAIEPLDHFLPDNPPSLQYCQVYQDILGAALSQAPTGADGAGRIGQYFTEDRWRFVL